jgi:thiosulfate/3-mercaptopyruvate sulfurtransferase
MPGARNVPASSLIDTQGRLLDAPALTQAFQSAGVDMTRAAHSTCGSGITAATLALALARLGRWDAAIYDGAWAEWGARDDTPIVTGAA